MLNNKIKEPQDWENIGFVAGKGTTTEENSYSYSDKDLIPGIYSYKLVQIDFGGMRKESEVISVEVGNRPLEYSLRQNYPNPFNPSTTIQYSVPKSGNVSVKIFNALGEEVAKLVDEYQKAGTYKVNFNGENLSSGIYFYQLRAGNFIETNKMVILR